MKGMSFGNEDNKKEVRRENKQVRRIKRLRKLEDKGKTDSKRYSKLKEKVYTPFKAIDRSKARRNDPDDGVVSASEASGGMFMKSPMKGKLKPCQKSAARAKFDVYPSAYANIWASKHKC